MLPSAAIFSGKNILADDLSKSLVAAGCKVSIHGKNIDKIDAEYVFVFWDFSGRLSEFEELQKLGGKRIIYVDLFASEKKKTFLKTVLVGDLYGPGMVVSGGSLSKALINIVLERKLEIPDQDFEIETTFSPDAAQDLTRIMLSYGLTEPVSLLSKRVSFFEILKEIERVIPDSLFIQGQIKNAIPKEVLFPRIRQKFEDSDAVKKTLEWLVSNPPSKKIPERIPVISSVSNPKVKRSNKLGINYIIASVALIIILVCLPFVLLLSSAGLLKLGFDGVKKGQFFLAKKTLRAANIVASTSQKTFFFYSKVPFLGKVFLTTEKFAEISTRASRIGIDAINLAINLENLAGNMLGSKSYDLESLSENTYLAIDNLYKEASFLQSEIDSLPEVAKKYSTQVNDFEKTRTFLLYGQVLARRMPILLGSQKPMTYLVLFQNNMELRPTGGFIGSFGLATFDKGILSNMEFFDVYTADGQLKGHIEPPVPIKNYLGEANWYLRDSNWDPDFQISAARAEWFLEKEIEKTVEGVIAVDLEVAKSILKEIGPMTLADVGVTVDEKNLYEKVQYYVEANFFPGSQNKSNILTSLGKGILVSLTTAKSETLAKIAESSIANFEAKHIQLFFHDNESRNAISSLGWDGGVPPEAFGLIEANVGVNKANYFIQRKMDIVSEVATNKVHNTMVVTLKNTSSIALGISGRYKSYMRLLAPGGASAIRIEISAPGGIRRVDPEIAETGGRTEVGVLVEVLPSETKTITFKWDSLVNLDFSKKGQLTFHLRKQAGTGPDPVTARIIMPNGVDFSGNTYYNTILARDLISRISWQ
ncbi:MAG: DUF4012 domain-containing protein [Patescibacteria group bacterium]